MNGGQWVSYSVLWKRDSCPATHSLSGGFFAGWLAGYEVGSLPILSVNEQYSCSAGFPEFTTFTFYFSEIWRHMISFFFSLFIFFVASVNFPFSSPTLNWTINHPQETRLFGLYNKHTTDVELDGSETAPAAVELYTVLEPRISEWPMIRSDPKFGNCT